MNRADTLDAAAGGSKNDGFEAARKKALEKNAKAPNESDDEEGPSGNDNDEEDGEDDDAHKSKRKAKKIRRELRASMEEYYKIEAEDFVAGLPCRFKYKDVKPNLFGLKVTDILAHTDKDLNQAISLKKLAPYRTDEHKCASARLKLL